MCSCLGTAVKRHVDFARGTHWFLDELTEEKENEKAFGLNKEDVDDLEQSGFSYCFKDDLKIATDEAKQKERDIYLEENKFMATEVSKGEISMDSNVIDDTQISARDIEKPNPF